jgi:hypothetical protein
MKTVIFTWIIIFTVNRVPAIGDKTGNHSVFQKYKDLFLPANLSERFYNKKGKQKMSASCSPVSALYVI